MWNNVYLASNPGYNFTDEMDYFRPDSPLIERQEIHEDLVADVKHACALLSHSIDRGIPAGLTYQSTVPDWTRQQQPAGQPSADLPSSFEQHIMVISTAKPIHPESESTKKHDSGVGMSFSSPDQLGEPYGNSLPGAEPGRFYNRQSSPSPSTPSENNSRSRSSSLADSIQPDPRELSFCSSPVPFPYSPPQTTGECTSSESTEDSPVSPLNDADRHYQAIEAQSKTQVCTYETAVEPSPAISPEEPSPGASDKNWPHTTKDAKNTDKEKAKIAKAKHAKAVSRFYRGNNQTTEAFDSREWLTKNFWEDRDPSIYREPSLASSLGMGNGSRPGTSTPRMESFSTSDEDSAYPYGTWGASRGLSYSSSCLGDEFKHQEDIYSAAIPNSRPIKIMNRRKKASLLLRKLAGLTLRRKEEREA